MANLAHVKLLKRDIQEWNDWRKANPLITPDLSHAALKELKLRDADLSFANLTSANMELADLTNANVHGAILVSARMRKAILNRADLSGANLTHASLHRAWLDETDLRNAILDNVDLDVNSCAGARFHGATITNVEYSRDVIQTHYAHTQGPLVFTEAEGLESLSPASSSFCQNLISDAFSFAHELAAFKMIAPRGEKKLEEALSRIRALELVYSRGVDHPSLIASVQAINTELIQFLRRHPQELTRLPWRTFEELIAELLRGFGWEIQLTQPSKDGGYDIFGLYRDQSGVKHTWIVECKRWSAERKVGIDIARALYTVKQEHGIGGALLATTSSFTAGVRAFKSSRYDFDLRDYAAVLEWINTYRK
jgi:uncharacterized protein YjbI with pentapeptide repeats